MYVYVAMCFDRLADDKIEVFEAIHGAIVYCQEFMNTSYYLHYGEWKLIDSVLDDEVYCIVFTEGSDLPSARIEKKKLR